MTRYELLDRIGVGGMAEIFRGKAVAAGGFEKPVAIKRILPHLSQDSRFVELLIAEAKVLSLLKHRNIVQIFDVGLGDDGKYFLVMEFVDGKDIGAVQRGLEAHRRRMPFDLVLHIGAEICEALEHAHSARAPDGKPMSLVHRDVSPSNVLLSRAGEVKLTDFGIAKRAEQETGHGAVRGKFAYISPEQARNEHLDPRSDVFSVGILMWELLTGRRLFSSLGDLDALRAVREAVIQRPTEIDRNLLKDVDSLVMPALAKDRERRYESAGQFGAKLRALRYSLEATVGDPATELAKIIDVAEEVERASSHKIVKRSSGFDLEPSEMTAFRIRTADAFSQRDVDGSSIVQARAIIDRFEEEETRLAQLSGEQMRILRSAGPITREGEPFRDSGELTAAAQPRPQRLTDEQTVARAPINPDDFPTYPPSDAAHEPQSNEDFTTYPPNQPAHPFDTPVNQRFDADEDTRLVAKRDHRRTPVPERNTHRPPPSALPPVTAPPPTPPPLVRPRGPTPGPPISRDPASASARAQNPLPGLPPPVMNGPTLLGPPPIPLGPPPSTSDLTPMPGTVHGRSQSQSESVRPQAAIIPSPIPAPAPPMPVPAPTLAPPAPAPVLPPLHVSPSNYPAWEGAPKRPPSPILIDERASKPSRSSKSKSSSSDDGRQRAQPGARASMQQIGTRRASKQPIKPWMLVVGAIVMAGLAFAVTRACIHPSANRAAAAAETKPP